MAEDDTPIETLSWVFWFLGFGGKAVLKMGSHVLKGFNAIPLFSQVAVDDYDEISNQKYKYDWINYVDGSTLEDEQDDVEDEYDYQYNQVDSGCVDPKSHVSLICLVYTEEKI